MFQDLRIVEDWSVADNVALPLRIAGTAEREIGRNVPELLAWLGLEKRIDVPASTLSGSERQLVAIARAIVGRPELLIADEPTGNVDEETALLLARIFQSMNRLGTTVLIATRNTAFARHPGGRVLRLENGTLSVAGLSRQSERRNLSHVMTSGNDDPVPFRRRRAPSAIRRRCGRLDCAAGSSR